MKLEEKKKAIILRETGKSIKDIAKILNISKASVSIWVRNVEIDSKQLHLLKSRPHTREAIEKRRSSRLKNESKKRERILNEAQKDIESISFQELKLIASALYWAEGRKRGKRIITFSNSDPILIKIMMRFFRDVCHVSEQRFRGHIHTHSHLNIVETEKYWSTITGIPLDQFYKTYSKLSISSQGKMDSLPYGTFDIYVCDSKLFLKIMGWIKKISTLLIGNI